MSSIVMTPSRGLVPLLSTLVLTLSTACGGGPPAAGPATSVSQPGGPAAGLACPSQLTGARQVRLQRGLGGLVYGSGRTGVVLAHQSNGDLCMWLPYAHTLAERGYRVLPFDFPGYGASTDALVAIDDAVSEAARFLRSDGAGTIVLIGASMGGTASIAAAPRIFPPVAGVVSLSAPTDYADARAIDAAKQLAVPVLYAAAEDDQAYAAVAQALYDATPATAARKLVLVPSGGHGVPLVHDAAGPPVGKDVDEFLKTYAPSA
jgi:pimeloyl-ACP methyl ester carboxylesterase